jgi:hypothetical protein
MTRDERLQHFVDVLDRALFHRLTPGSVEWRVAREIFGALKKAEAPGTNVPNPPLPAQQYLAWALDIARKDTKDLAAVADAFDDMEPGLGWYRRKGAEEAGQEFADGHANTIIIGPSGLERRSDVQIGVSLVAPNIQYADHHHPPAEIYLAMTPGAWRQERLPWIEPGVGGIVYNRPDVVHAMKSGNEPLFAVWCLLGGGLDR